MRMQTAAVTMETGVEVPQKARNTHNLVVQLHLSLEYTQRTLYPTIEIRAHPC